MVPDGPLDGDETAHTARVRALIADEIAGRGGWIGFERYMELALYAPGLGYYSAGTRKLGVGGDFTTAPEVSSLFGACVARQCAQVLDMIPRGSILEIGAGTGKLAVDILQQLAALERLPQQYWILDVSADLRARQRQLLAERCPALLERVRWLDEPPAAPFDGLVVANEVLDALPVTRFRWHRAGSEELGVACRDGRFVWAARRGGAELQALCERLAASAGGWDEGYESEYCPRLGAWTRSVLRCLRRGAVLWFDYGLPRAQYYLPERHEGTFICHFRQRFNDDPFLYPGLQDISAWVDFTALAESCEPAGCELAGFTTQAYFLAGLRVDEAMHTLAGGDASRFARLANQARQLMLPGEMGERFKVMGWTRGIEGALDGFALRDLRHTL